MLCDEQWNSLKHFSFKDSTLLNFLSRGHWSDTAGRRGFLQFLVQAGACHHQGHRWLPTEPTPTSAWQPFHSCLSNPSTSPDSTYTQPPLCIPLEAPHLLDSLGKPRVACTQPTVVQKLIHKVVIPSANTPPKPPWYTGPEGLHPYWGWTPTACTFHQVIACSSACSLEAYL